MWKPKRKPKKNLNFEQRKAFAQEIINGKMIKQAAAEFGISAANGYKIFGELLEYKVDWKFKELENAK